MTGLYIHIPFCLKKCGYCDFVSYENCFDEAETYIGAVLQEMEEYRGEKIDTVYVGGGTPTSLPEGLLEKLLGGVFACFDVAEDNEITVECNPKTADLAYLSSLRKVGYHRISIGVQSLHDEELTFLGRLHTAREAEESVQLAKLAGFSNISLDCMFGFPGQTEERFLESLRRIIALGPAHISSYSLILEENTPFYREYIAGRLIPMDDELERDLYEKTVEVLGQSGYRRYEISNFARPGMEARHNVKYWTREPYIGLGAAAHSFYGGCRYANPAGLKDYYKRVQEGPLAEQEKTRLTRRDEMSEFMYLGMRMSRGVSQREFEEQFGKKLFDVFGESIRWLESLKLVETAGDAVQLTPKGINVSNSVFSRFLLD